MDVVEQIEQLVKQGSAENYYNCLEDSLIKRYGLSVYKQRGMYQKSNIAVQIGHEYNQNSKYMVAIKEEGYRKGFSLEDCTFNLTLKELFGLLDKKIGTV